MSEIELLEDEIARREAYVNRLLNDPHKSIYDEKLIKPQQEIIVQRKAKLEALKRGKANSEPVFVSREEAERGEKAKQNQEFPVIKKTQGKYKRNVPIHVSPVSIAEGFNVVIR